MDRIKCLFCCSVRRSAIHLEGGLQHALIHKGDVTGTHIDSQLLAGFIPVPDLMDEPEDGEEVRAIE